MSAKVNSFPYWATLFTVLSAMILCGLGTWQVIRLEWKKDLLASLDQEYAKQAVDYPLEIADLDALEKNHVKRGVIKGEISDDQIIFIHNGQQGYDLYTPLETAQGSILVQLGKTQEKENINLPKQITVTGTARLKSQPWRFGIENVPERGQWVYLDLDDVRSFTKRPELSQVVLYAETVTPIIEGVATTSERFTPNNNHLKYALFWFTMCAVLLFVYYKRFWGE